MIRAINTMKTLLKSDDEAANCLMKRGC